jgi:hypothetical protein
VRIRRSAGWRRALPAVGLLALAAYLVFAVPTALVASWARVETARGAARENARDAHVRLRGSEYVAAIERIRDILPEDAEYLLIEGTSDALVRFDLAPRRAIFGGNTRDLRTNVTLEKLTSLPHWAVIPSLDPPGPRLVETRLIAEKGALP